MYYESKSSIANDSQLTIRALSDVWLCGFVAGAAITIADAVFDLFDCSLTGYIRVCVCLTTALTVRDRLAQPRN